MRLLLPVPDCPRQGILFSDAILVDGTEGSASQLLCLLIVGLEPHGLQLGVRIFSEPMVLQNVIKVSVVSGVEGHQGPRPQDRFMLVEGLAGRRVDRKWPEEPAEPLDVTWLLQGLAYLRHLLRGKVKRGQVQHAAEGHHGAVQSQIDRGGGRCLIILLDAFLRRGALGAQWKRES